MNVSLKKRKAADASWLWKSDDSDEEDEENEKRKKAKKAKCTTDWCRYCGATKSSHFTKGPWGRRMLCTPHYVKWWQRKSLDLSMYPNEPTQAIDPAANTEKKYVQYMSGKKKRTYKKRTYKKRTYKKRTYKKTKKCDGVCDLCEFRTKDGRAALVRHRMSVHRIDENGKPVIYHNCNNCDYKSIFPSHITAHQKSGACERRRLRVKRRRLQIVANTCGERRTK